MGRRDEWDPSLDVVDPNEPGRHIEETGAIIREVLEAKWDDGAALPGVDRAI